MAGSEFYDHTTYPTQGSSGASASLRAELDSIETGFGKLAGLSGNSEKIVRVNTGETAHEAVAGSTVVGEAISGATAKTTPVDADTIGISDSAASNVLKSLSWANLKATIKTYYDSVSATLTNKTISADSNTISGVAASSFVVSDASGYIDGAAAQKAIPSGVVVGTTDTQTLTNKTIVAASNTITTASSGNLAATELNAALAELQADIDTRASGSYQPLDADLTAIAGLTSAANKVPYFTGSGTAAVADLTAYGRSVVAVADEAALKALVNLEIGTDVQAYDAELAALAGLTSAANKVPMFSGLGTATVIDFLDEDAMTSNSATAVPSQQSVKAYVDAAGSAWELVSTTNVTATTNIDFDLQEDVYCEWKFVIDGVIPATDNSTLRIQMGYSAGTSFETSSYGSSFVGTSVDVSGNDIIGSATGSNGVGTSAGQHAHAVVTIGGVGSSLAAGFFITSMNSYVGADADARSGKTDIWYSGLTERVWDTVRFLWEVNGAGSGGTWEATGTIKMFAMKRAG